MSAMPNTHSLITYLKPKCEWQTRTCDQIFTLFQLPIQVHELWARLPIAWCYPDDTGKVTSYTKGINHLVLRKIMQ